jgi:hypothetical protein
MKKLIVASLFSLGIGLAPTAAHAALIVANATLVGGLAGGQSSALSLLAANFLSPSVATFISSVDLPLVEAKS